VRVAGRALSCAGLELVVADATAQLVVHFAPPLTNASRPGNWVLVEGEWDGSALTSARLLSSSPGQLLPAGESTRFSRVGAHLERCALAQRWVRRYFDQDDFVEVRTPVRVSAPDTAVYVEPHQTRQGWLITSPEFHMKRLLVGGLPRIYQFAACTREEESGLWHQPEFTMLEWYRAFAPMTAVMQDTFDIVSGLFEELGPPTPLGPKGLPIDLEHGFERVTVRELFHEHAGIADASELAASDEARYFQTFVDLIEPAIALRARPLFVTEYPRSQAALAAPCPHDPSVAERFELYVGGVELCNGYGELTDASEQRLRFDGDVATRRARRLPELPIDQEFIAALEEGMPPAAGNALGFERLLALILGVPLADVVAFPR
jgi:lysyl-tRNA synthetase class 2